MITTDRITAYAGKRQKDGLAVSSINRELQVLRRMFTLAQEWTVVDKVLPKVNMLPGERHRDRVISDDEESAYLNAAPELLRQVATVLVDTAMRPEECFRMRWEDLQDDAVMVQHGKTESARRRIPLTPRVLSILEMRKTDAASEWVFPAPTKSGHMNRQALRNNRPRLSRRAVLRRSNSTLLRHTCLTRWAPHMDPFMLGYLAGHTDMGITKRYVHPQSATVQEAMKRASGHRTGHTDNIDDLAKTGTVLAS